MRELYALRISRPCLLVLLLLMTKTYAFTQDFTARGVSTAERQRSAGQATTGLREALKSIETRLGVFFAYKNNTVDNKTVPLSVVSDFLENTNRNDPAFDKKLARLLAYGTLQFEKIDDIYFIMDEGDKTRRRTLRKESETMRQGAVGNQANGSDFTLLSPPKLKEAAPARDILVKGRVTDDKNEPLPGVSVTVKGTSTGTSTDIKGDYSMSVPDNNAVLVFSSIGFLPEEAAVGSRTTINVTLMPDVKALSEIVVVGYGTQQKRDVTGAISQVKSQEIKQVAVTGLDQALQGRAAGVQVTQNSGEPGGSVSVRIRGVGSFGTNEPLYIIDGFPTQSGLNAINPNDIESIEILKDASAAAIYGSRASNGVVIVTTKRGAVGKTRVELDVFAGVQAPGRTIGVLNGPEFTTLANEAYRNSNLRLNPAWSSPASMPTYDWQAAIFQNTPVYSANLSISGGTEKSRSAITASYFRQDGLIVGSNYDRYTFRANNDYNVSSKLRFGNSLTVSRDGGRYIPSNRDFDGVLQTAYQMHPMQPITAPDGPQSPTVFGYQGYAHFPLTTDGLYYPRQLYNPVWGMQKRYNSVRRNTRLLGTFFGEYDITEGLRFRSSIGIDLSLSQGNDFTPFVQQNIFGATTRSDISDNRSESLTWNWINTLAYSRTFGKHTVTALAGIDALKGQGSFVSANGNTLPSNDIRAVGLATPQSFNLSGGPFDFALLSYIGRVTYAYADKYLFTFSVRRDGSANFGPLNRFGTFPSFSVGWRVSEESFMKNIPVFSDLKIRASWGQLGNQNIGAFRYISTLGTDGVEYTVGTGAQQAAPAITVRNLGNPDIRWEATTQTDIGVDGALLDGRFTFTVDYFNRATSDMLVNIPVPQTLGAPGNVITRNAGSMVNRGWEFAVGYRQALGAFKLSADVNFSTLANEVTSLGGGAPIVRGLGVGGNNAATRTEVGQPIAYFWGLQTDGIFQTIEEVNNSAQRGNAQPGDRRFRDINNDGTINSDDRVNLGNGLPRYLFGANLRVEFRGFDLNMLWQGQAGNKIANNNLRHLYDIRNYNGAGVQNLSRDMLNRWTGPGTSNEFPKVSYNPTSTGFGNNNAFSTYYIENGSFLRLRNIQLGYTLPAAFASRFKAERARFYISAQNLLTITSYSGFDPEVGSLNQEVLTTGFDQGRYPVSRIFMAGFNLQF